jgi:tetratricopeptide (TPR) repeat protein
MSSSFQPKYHEHLLGEILVKFGLVSQDSCSKALQKAGLERELAGQIFLSTGLISQEQLQAAIHCQSLVREGLVNLDQAAAAIKMTEGGQSLEAAFDRFGISIENIGKRTLIGELLVKSGCISAGNLKFALAQQKKTMLPIGHILVSVGLLSDELLSASLNAQSFIRAGNLDKSVAIEALRQLKQKRVKPSADSPKRERKFYQQAQEKKVPSLEDLLVNSKVITKEELLSAHRQHLLTAEKLTSVFLEKNLLDSETLDVAVELLKLARSKSLTMEEAQDILVQVTHGDSIGDALHNIQHRFKEDKAPCLINLLREFGCINNAKLAIAFNFAQNDSQILSRILLNSGMQDEVTLHKVEECQALIQQYALNLADAHAVFDLSTKKSISIAAAMKIFSEEQLANPEVNAVPLEVMDSNFDQEKWQKSWRSAIALIEQNDVAGGRLLLESLLEAATSKRVVDYIACLDAIAETYTREQNYELAERYYSFALDMRLQHYEIDSLECAAGMNVLGKIYYFQKRYEESEKCVKEFIRISSKRLGQNHANVACGWQNVANIYQAQGKFYYAEHGYKLAIKICLETLGENHPTTVKAKIGYANLLVHIRRLTEAESLHPAANGECSGSWRTIDLDEMDNGGSLAVDSA